MRTAALVSCSCFVLALSVSGCLHEPLEQDVGFYSPEPAPDPVVQREITVQYEGPANAVAATPAMGPSPLDRLRPDPVPFRIGAAHGALGTVDLGPCRDKGLPPGYLRMRVTFHRNGHVSHAVVEGPTPPSQEALDCIAEQLESAEVPAFDGRDAALSRRYFVEPGATPPPPEDIEVRKAGSAAPLSQLTKP